MTSASLSRHQTDVTRHLGNDELYFITRGQHFLSRGKVLRKTLAYITCAITQTYFTQPKGREAPVKKWRKYWERGLSWPCSSLRGERSEVRGNVRWGKAGVSGRLIIFSSYRSSVHVVHVLYPPPHSFYSLLSSVVPKYWTRDELHIVIVATFKQQSALIDILTLSKWFVHNVTLLWKYFSKHVLYIFRNCGNKIKCQQNASWC